MTDCCWIGQNKCGFWTSWFKTNWANEQIPTKNDNVYIPDNKTIWIYGHVECKNMYVGSSKLIFHFLKGSGGGMTISGTIVMQGMNGPTTLQGYKPNRLRIEWKKRNIIQKIRGWLQ